MAFRPSDVIGVIWHHPILSLVVLLLFTPPLFPIVVYFSPLLISTVLFVLAMISMESDHADDPHPFSSDIPYNNRVWIEEVELDGPFLDGERVPKRLKASSNDASWLDKVRNLEGTGRALVDSILNQESCRSIDDIISSRDESIPLLHKAREFFVEDVRKRSRDDELKASQHSDVVEGMVCGIDSAPSPVKKAGNLEDQPRLVAVDGGESSSKVIPDLECEDELIEIAPAIISPSPQFGSKLLPIADTTIDSATQLSKKSDVVPLEAPSKAVETGCGSVPGTDSEGGENDSSRSVPLNQKDSSPPAVEEKLVELAPTSVDNSPSRGEIATPTISLVAMEVTSDAKETAQGSGKMTPKIESISSGVHRTNVSGRNLAHKSQLNSTTECDRGKSGFQCNDTKSVAELHGIVRPGRGSYVLGAQSAAVALSEKLKVPLADIMSLLVGDCKENASNDTPSGVEVPSSSETTTSQEEEWSSSDAESSAPPATGRCPDSVEKAP